MNHDPKKGYETKTDTAERIRVIGGDLPSISDMYDELSEVRDIRVVETDQPHSQRGERRDVSEKEIIDDLMRFCDRVRALPTDHMDERDRELVASVDDFVMSMHFLSSESYAKAVNGHAQRHAAWLEEDDNHRLRFAVQRNKQQSSQGVVGSDIRTDIIRVNPELEGRVDITLIEDVTTDMTADTKIILADDWSVSGNYVAQDVAHVYQVFDRTGAMAFVEVNLLLARQDQVEKGIHTLDRLKEDKPEYGLPQVVSYYKTPAVESVYGYKAIPTGAHSATDYGFSETLGSMYRLVERYGKSSDHHVPYAATIIPRYAYNYDQA